MNNLFTKSTNERTHFQKKVTQELSNKKNLFTHEWEKIEKQKSTPKNYRKLVQIDYKEFVNKIIEQDPKFVKSFVESIYHGDLYLLKNSISKDEIDHIKNEFLKFSKSNESTFYKMLEGSPNFHRWVDGSASKKGYSLSHIKHSYYLFSWNKDETGIREIIMKSHRPLKFSAGLSINEYEKNTPKDKIVERVQIVRYIPKGFVEPHVDPVPICRLVFSAYLSKRGDSDYSEGGFYMIDKKNGKLDMEESIDSGDIGFFYASLRHGVDMIDPTKNADMSENCGRWWIGYNIHNSDYIDSKNRHTGVPYNIRAKN